jgi:hypothetical protein
MLFPGIFESPMAGHGLEQNDTPYGMTAAQ